MLSKVRGKCMDDKIMVECIVTLLEVLVDLYYKGEICYKLFEEHVEKKKLFLELFLEQDNSGAYIEASCILMKINEINQNSIPIEV